tara:strand:- start:914 stop:1261 length:348 start_codon:yes stop_codon:yes gene_type:complete
MSELQAENRKILEAKLAKLRGRMNKITDDLRQEKGALSPDFAEQAVELENSEVLEHLDGSGRREADEIVAALNRMDEGEYGICVECGDGIKEGRLKAVPAASMCISCANEAEKAA